MTESYEFKKWSGEWWKTPKGHWSASGSDWTENSAFLCCPICGEVARLPHAVNFQGKVTPSVVCPNGPKCPMHLSPVTLAEWDLGEKPSER
jgi:hypothetical protein